MRILEFRGRRLDNNEWVYGCIGYGFNSQEVQYIMPRMYFATRDFGEVDDDGETIIEDYIALGGFIPIKPETLGQFTGLNDVNGNKIYEYDILKVMDKEYKVIWGAGGFLYLDLNDLTTGDLINLFLNEIVIVNNE